MTLEEQLLGRSLQLEPPGPRPEKLADSFRERIGGVGDQGPAMFRGCAPARERRGDDRKAVPHHVEHLHLHPGAEADRRDSQRRRTERLLENSPLAPSNRGKLHAPLGLDIGADNPEEIALALVAEIRAWSAGRDGRPLTLREGPIH